MYHWSLNLRAKRTTWKLGGLSGLPYKLTFHGVGHGLEVAACRLLHPSSTSNNAGEQDIENQWLEDEFAFGKPYFQGPCQCREVTRLTPKKLELPVGN